MAVLRAKSPKSPKILKILPRLKNHLVWKLENQQMDLKNPKRLKNHQVHKQKIPLLLGLLKLKILLQNHLILKKSQMKHKNPKRLKILPLLKNRLVLRQINHLDLRLPHLKDHLTDLGGRHTARAQTHLDLK